MEIQRVHRPGPPRAKATARPMVTQPEPRDAFTPSSPLRQAFEALPPSGPTRATMLADNLQAWNARWRLLESARDTVTAQYYTWDHDVFGKAQLGHIYLRARQGAEVRVMVDAVGDTFGTRGFKSQRGGQDYLQELVALPNAEAKVYHPHYKKPISALLHPTGLQAIAANHDKILEVDGRAAIVGGRNTGWQYFSHPSDNPQAWRDGDVQLEGSRAALQLRNAVDEEYDRRLVNHEIHPDLLGNWRKRDAELLGAFQVMDLWLKGDPLSDLEKTQLRESRTARRSAARDLVDQAIAKLPGLGLDREVSERERMALQEMAVELTGHPELRGSYHACQPAGVDAEVRVIDKTSSVGSGLDEMNEALLGLVAGARESIVLQTPYYVLTDPVIDALQDAGERGVDIRVATNSPSNTDSYFTQVFFLNDWEKSLATIPNMELFAATGDRKHHAKMAVIDDQVSVVGTYNLDLVSAAVNGEVAAVIWSPEFAKGVTGAIAADFADPTVGYQEYRIARDASGQAVDAAGRPVVDAEGNLVGKPQSLFGPEDHVDPKLLEKYDKRIGRWNRARKLLPQFRSLRRFVRGDK